MKRSLLFLLFSSMAAALLCVFPAVSFGVDQRGSQQDRAKALQDARSVVEEAETQVRRTQELTRAVLVKATEECEAIQKRLATSVDLKAGQEALKTARVTEDSAKGAKESSTPGSRS